MTHADFAVDPEGLQRANELLARWSGAATDGPIDLHLEDLPLGVGPEQALELLAPVVLGSAARLGAPSFFAHMDPPTPWITWAAHQWAAHLNQNLLHTDTAPAARQLEQWLINQLAPIWGMTDGILVPGSTVANLTALWAARDRVGVTTVVASDRAHLSIAKAAKILGLELRIVGTDVSERIDEDALGDLSSAALVLTAGTTSTGAIDPLGAGSQAAWRHIDAAWSGALQLSSRHQHLLDGIEKADSLSMSAHKWLFQPKESAVVLFREAASMEALTFDGAYLGVPNVGLLGSHGAGAAVALAATLVAYGPDGIAGWIEVCMGHAAMLEALIDDDERLERWPHSGSGVVNWRPVSVDVDELVSGLVDATVSTTTIGGERWLRSVAANPMADAETVVGAVCRVAFAE